MARSDVAPPAQPFLVPDVPHSLVEQTQVRERWFTLNPGLVFIADYTAFNQDDASISQVGKQQDQVRLLVFDLSALRNE